MNEFEEETDILCFHVFNVQTSFLDRSACSVPSYLAIGSSRHFETWPKIGMSPFIMFMVEPLGCFDAG
jgi:hypothetical protein